MTATIVVTTIVMVVVGNSEQQRYHYHQGRLEAGGTAGGRRELETIEAVLEKLIGNSQVRLEQSNCRAKSRIMLFVAPGVDIIGIKAGSSKDSQGAGNDLTVGMGC